MLPLSETPVSASRPSWRLCIRAWLVPSEEGLLSLLVGFAMVVLRCHPKTTLFSSSVNVNPTPPKSWVP